MGLTTPFFSSLVQKCSKIKNASKNHKIIDVLLPKLLETEIQMQPFIMCYDIMTIASYAPVTWILVR